MRSALMQVGKEFLRVTAIFWYFMPLFLVSFLAFLAYVSLAVDVPKYIPPHLIVASVFLYLFGGFGISGMIIYRLLGDKLNLPPLIRALISFVLLFFWGVMVVGGVLDFFQGIFAGLLEGATVWIEASIFQGAWFEVVIKSFFVCLGMYLVTCFAWASIPIFLIIALLRVGR